MCKAVMEICTTHTINYDSQGIFIRRELEEKKSKPVEPERL